MLHLFAHNDKNFVKVGDKVKAYKTKIGSIGTANGSYYAHLHHSWSNGLTITQLRSYIKGWSKEKVKKYYSKPTCDYTKMFGRKMDIGKAGWGWLDDIGGGFHPGLDINGLGGGNTDIGYEYTSDCDGEVVYVSNTNSKDGWGKIVCIDDTIKPPTIVKTFTGTTLTQKELETRSQVITVPQEASTALNPQPGINNSTANFIRTPILTPEQVKDLLIEMPNESADIPNNAQKTQETVQSLLEYFHYQIMKLIKLIFKIK